MMVANIFFINNRTSIVSVPTRISFFVFQIKLCTTYRAKALKFDFWPEGVVPGFETWLNDEYV